MSQRLVNDILRQAEQEIYQRTRKTYKLKAKFIDKVEHLDYLQQCLAIWEVPLSYITNKSRERDRVIMRTILAYKLKAYPLSLKEIGDVIGITDHSTVLARINSFESWLFVKDVHFLKYYLPIKHLVNAPKEI